MSNNAVQEIRELLQHGMGSDSENRRMAEERLLKAEKEHTGTYLETLLTLVYECNNENTSISHFAGILFKKTVSSFWMSGSINESVKHGIRTSLVDRLPTLPPNAPINQLSEALSQMCVSEVIHGSNLPPFPENSNIPYCCITLDLVVQTLNRVAEEGEDTQRFASFLSQFSGTNGFVLMMLQYARVLLLPLHLAIKYLFENHKNTLLSNVSGDALKELINLVCEKWMFAMIILTDILEDDDITYDDPQEEREEQELITRLSEVCSVSMRLLRRIIGLGFTLSEKSKHSTEEISDELHKAMTQYADLQQALFDGRNNPRSTINNGYMKHVLEKQIINATKAVKELVGRFPLSMNVYLPSILKFYLPKILSSPSVNQLPEESFERKFLVYALHCFTESFESSSIYEQIQNTLEIVFEGIDNMKQLLFVILTRFLPLNQQELELCESDPQEYIQEQLLESYQYDIKASAKFLWLSMIRNCKQLPTIALEMISQFLQAPCDPNDMREFLLRREACYHALSLCYNEFSPLISFSSFFSSMILPDANRKEREYRLIKRQIANLFVEDWSRDLGDQLPTALQMLVSFQKEDDYIVSIWASIAFRNICNGYILQNLDPQQFQGFATEALNAMITLTLKLKVDSVAEIVVENIGRMCLVMGGKLLANGVGLKVIEGLLGLWQQAGSSMLKNTIIRCMSSAVHSGVTNIPDNPQTELQVEEHITKLILVSTNINSDRNMIHTAEGISLWKNMIERNENGKDKCWLINRYPSSLKERLKQLLNIPNEIPHLNPPSFISLLQHHTILIPAFFTSCKSEITLIIGNILSSPKKISWKIKALGYLLIICQIHKQQAIESLVPVFEVIVKQFVTMDQNSQKYNIFYHQLLCGMILYAFAIHPNKIIEWLVSANALDQFLNIHQQLHGRMSLDSFLSKLSCRFLCLMLCQDNSPLLEHADFVVYSCINAESTRGLPVINELYEGNPEGYLLEQYNLLWSQDITNQENILSFTKLKISSSPIVQSKISEKALRALESATQENVINIPKFTPQNSSAF